MSAAVATPPLRRQYEDLHPKDQQIKQTKKLCMELNWQCPIQDCLPEEIRPRVEVKKGAKVRINDEPAEVEDWWNWSVELLKALEELSAMTVGDLDYARELLLIEVQQRQQNPKSTQRKILEVLLGDVQKVVDEQRKRVQAGFHANMMDTDDSGMDIQYGGAANMAMDPRLALGPHHAGQPAYLADHAYDFERENTAIHPTVEDDDAASAFSPPHRNATIITPPSSDPVATLPDHSSLVKIAELKARACRARAEALRLDAEAMDWEVKAAQRREELEKDG
ncbi:hypothetical protein MBLNU457_g2783t1 [Dothideomycetes sp. NU457]